MTISLHLIIRLRRPETAKNVTINRPDVSNSCESQARSSSRRFRGKLEQNITTKIHAKKDDGSAV